MSPAAHGQRPLVVRQRRGEHGDDRPTRRPCAGRPAPGKRRRRSRPSPHAPRHRAAPGAGDDPCRVDRRLRRVDPHHQDRCPGGLRPPVADHPRMRDQAVRAGRDGALHGHVGPHRHGGDQRAPRPALARPLDALVLAGDVRRQPGAARRHRARRGPGPGHERAPRRELQPPAGGPGPVGRAGPGRAPAARRSGCRRAWPPVAAGPQRSRTAARGRDPAAHGRSATLAASARLLLDRRHHLGGHDHRSHGRDPGDGPLPGHPAHLHAAGGGVHRRDRVLRDRPAGPHRLDGPLERPGRRLELPPAAGPAQRLAPEHGPGHVRDHRGGHERADQLSLLVPGKGVRALRRPQGRDAGLGKAGPGMDVGHALGRRGLHRGLHLRHRRLLPAGRRRAPPRRPGPRRQPHGP